MTTTYIVIPFQPGKKKGKLALGTAQTFKSREQANRLFDRLKSTTEGLVMLEQEADPVADIYDDPKLVDRHGTVIREFIEQFQG